MIAEQICLQDIFPALSSLPSPTPLTTYCRDTLTELRPRRFPAVIICPGGGYGGIAGREGEPIALAFLAQGIQCFVLRYHTAPVRYPAQLTELAAAVAFVRTNAERYSIDPEHISVMGFSAGGHLVGSYATHWHEPQYAEMLGCTRETLRPNGVVPCYGVLSGGEHTHDGTMKNLLGEQDSPEMRRYLSFEENVTADTPPAFIWHTVADQAVPVENALLAASALNAHKIPFELHIYPEGRHGLALVNWLTAFDQGDPPPRTIANWVNDCADWMLRLAGIDRDAYRS